MRGWVVLLGLIACGPGLKQPDMREVGRAELGQAASDPIAFDRLLRGSTANGGLWFDDPACRKQFPGSEEIGADRLSAFSRCIVGLHLQPSMREDALGDVVVMTYAPGFEIEARVVGAEGGPRLVWIGFASRRTPAEPPTITSQAFEASRLTGDRNGALAPSVANELELELVPEHHSAFSWIKVCLDATGAVTSAHPYETTSSKAQDVFAAAARAWTFRPFTVGDQPIPVCSMVLMTYPPTDAAVVETLPMPPPPSNGAHEPIVFAPGVSTKTVQGHRIHGEAQIAPDDHTKTRIGRSGITRVTGTFRLCINDTGHVESVLPMRSTRFADYDRELMAGMRTWVYTPFQVGDAAIPVCATITFIYSQHSSSSTYPAPPARPFR